MNHIPANAKDVLVTLIFGGIFGALIHPRFGLAFIGVISLLQFGAAYWWKV